MKDNRLEKEFDEYFNGVNTPDNITDDAKKYVKPKNKVLPKFVKFASVAASFVLVFAVALTVFLKADFNKTPSDEGASSGNNSAVVPPPSEPDISNPPSYEPDRPSSIPGGSEGEGNGGTAGEDNEGTAGEGDNANDSDQNPEEETKIYYYYDSELTTVQQSAYTVSEINASLKFIEDWAVAENTNVTACEAKYKNGSLTLVKADAEITDGLNRDATTIYVEFTVKTYVYKELSDYFQGTRGYYKDAQYYLTENTGENGETEFKLYIFYNEVKYYFNIHSSDKQAYERYLNLIVK